MVPTLILLFSGRVTDLALPSPTKLVTSVHVLSATWIDPLGSYLRNLYVTPCPVLGKAAVFLVIVGFSRTEIVSFDHCVAAFQLPSCVFVINVPRETFFTLSIAVFPIILHVSIFFRAYRFIFGPALSLACSPALTRLTSGRLFSVLDHAVRS